MRSDFYNASVLGLGADGRLCREEVLAYYDVDFGKWDVSRGTVTHWREYVPDTADIEEFKKREREARLWSLQT